MRVIVRVPMLVLFVLCLLPQAHVFAQSDDPEDYGFVDDGEWVGDLYDTEVAFDPEAWNPYLNTSSGSFPANGYEIVTLGSADEIGNLSVLVMEPPDTVDDIEDLAEVRGDDRTMSFPDTEVLDVGSDDDVAWFVHAVPYEGGDFFVLGEVTEGPETYTIVELLFEPGNAGDLAELVDDTVELDGEPPFGRHFDEDAIADLELDTYEFDAQTNEDPEELGFVDDETWVSPTTGVEASWGGAWELDADKTVVSDAFDVIFLNAGTWLVYIQYIDEDAQDGFDAFMEGYVTLRQTDFASQEFTILAVEQGETADGDGLYAGFAYSLEFEGETWIGVAEVVLIDGVYQQVQLTAPAAEFEDAFAEAADEIETDGRAPLLEAWDEDDLPSADDDPIDPDDVDWDELA